MSNRPRTISTIQQTLARTTRPARVPYMPANPINKYIMCRLDPFSNAKSEGIPDGNPAPRILIDHRAFSTVTIGSSGGFIIRMQPVPNMPTLIRPIASDNSDRTFAVDGLTIPANATGNTFTFGQDSWSTFLNPYEWAAYNALVPNNQASAGTAPECPNPYSASKFRIVSCSLRIIYTGTAMNAAGAIVVRRNRATYTYGGGLNQSEIIGSYNNGTNVANYGQILVRNIFVSRYDLNDNSAILDRTTQTFRPEVAVVASLVRTSDTYDHYPITPVKVMPLDSSTYKPVVNALFSNSDTAYNRFPCFAGYDDSWENTLVQVSGAVAGTTFRVEMNFCVEYVPSQNSNFAPLASPSPVANREALVAAERLVASRTAASAPGSNRSKG